MGVLLTMFSRNEKICRQVESMLRKELGDKLLQTKIRVNTKAKAAPSVRKSIFDYEQDKKGRGTEDFTALAKEILEKIELSESLEQTQENEKVANG